MARNPVPESVPRNRGVSATALAATSRLDTTIIKGMHVLEALANSAPPLGVTELARLVGLHKSNIHRILNTMLELGYVQKDHPTARYRLSLKLWEIGARIINRSQLRRVARPFMRQLHNETLEFIFLTVLDGNDILYLDTVDAAFPLSAGIMPSARVPASFPASGKVLLAYQSDLDRVVQEAVRTAPPGRALDTKAFAHELRDIRKRGYATSNSGWTIGRNSVSAAIITEDHQAIGSIGIGGPEERFPPARLLELSASTRNAATRIAESLSVHDHRTNF